ncbi:MAG: phosphatidylglycerophosphatase A [Wigglesworthia glossinidia]|nr:phosphatidylglycerophosphatase A [Wigglesworthia glossinidia]
MQLNQKKSKFSMCNPIHNLSTGFGIGFVPYMPGTIASVVAIFIWNYIKNIFIYNWYIIFIFILISGYFCDKTTKALSYHDHPCIVLDEFIGMWLILLLNNTNDFYHISVSFIVFRIFDIWKPYPIQLIHKNILNGFGIVLDDIIAGIYSVIILKILI